MEGKIQGVGWAVPITRVGWLQVMNVTRNRSLGWWVGWLQVMDVTRNCSLGWRIQRVNSKFMLS